MIPEAVGVVVVEAVLAQRVSTRMDPAIGPLVVVEATAAGAPGIITNIVAAATDCGNGFYHIILGLLTYPASKGGVTTNFE